VSGLVLVMEISWIISVIKELAINLVDDGCWNDAICDGLFKAAPK